MTVYTIPLAQDSNFQERVDLDGDTYVLRVRWNDRAGAAFLDVLDGDENPIAMGRKCVVDTVLAPLPFTDAKPPGRLMLFDTTYARKDPESIADLGTRVVLLYVDAAEVAAW